MDGQCVGRESWLPSQRDGKLVVLSGKATAGARLGAGRCSFLCRRQAHGSYPPTGFILAPDPLVTHFVPELIIGDVQLTFHKRYYLRGHLLTRKGKEELGVYVWGEDNDSSDGRRGGSPAGKPSGYHSHSCQSSLVPLEQGLGPAGALLLRNVQWYNDDLPTENTAWPHRLTELRGKVRTVGSKGRATLDRKASPGRTREEE